MKNEKQKAARIIRSLRADISDNMPSSLPAAWIVGMMEVTGNLADYKFAIQQIEDGLQKLAAIADNIDGGAR